MVEKSDKETRVTKPELNQLNAVIFPSSNNAIEFTTEINKQYTAFPTSYMSEIELDKRNEPKLASLIICDRHGKTIFSYHQVYDAMLVPEIDVENVTYVFDSIPTNPYKLNKFIESMTGITDMHTEEIAGKIYHIDSDMQSIMKKDKIGEDLEEKLSKLIDEKSKLQNEKDKLNVQYALSNTLLDDLNYAIKLKKQAEELAVRESERKINRFKSKEDKKFEKRIRVLAGSETIEEFLSNIEGKVGSERYSKIIQIFNDEKKRLEEKEKSARKKNKQK